MANEDARELEQELTAAWQAMAGAEPGDLVEDLKILKMIFGQSVSPTRLAERIQALPAIDIARSASKLYPSLILEAGGGSLVTLEGRIAIEILRREPQLSLLALAAEIASHPTTIETYREWTLERVSGLVSTVEGLGETMYPAAIAATLLLLLRGADSKTPLPIPGKGDRADQLLMQPVDALNQILSQRPPKRMKAAFREYPLKKAERRLGSLLVVDRSNKRRWLASIAAGQRSPTLAIVTAELQQRTGGSQAFRRAFEEFATAYGSVAPQLDQLGIGWSAIEPNQLLRDLRAPLRSR